MTQYPLASSSPFVNGCILLGLHSQPLMHRMKYQVIARKFRPQLFDDVVGQKPIVQTLQNAIQMERIGHAYLFSGPRGVGKTTTARILAKGLNCVKGPTITPAMSVRRVRRSRWANR